MQSAAQHWGGLCATLALIYRGELIAFGTPEELKRSRALDNGTLPSLEDVFIELIEERNRKGDYKTFRHESDMPRGVKW